MSAVYVTYPRSVAKQADGADIRLSFTSPMQETNVYSIPPDAVKQMLAYNNEATTVTVQMHRSNGSDASQTVAGTSMPVRDGDALVIGLLGGRPTLTKTSPAAQAQSVAAQPRAASSSFSSYWYLAGGAAILLVALLVWYFYYRSQ